MGQYQAVIYIKLLVLYNLYAVVGVTKTNFLCYVAENFSQVVPDGGCLFF